LSGVFLKDGQRTHLAYNPEATARTVHFSDGVSVEVPAHSLGRDR